jgi:N-acetyl-anhydromuramyl-L-alanine amidase AmpD
MAQSAEYPDLKWVPPKSWTNANRTSVQLIVIHDTEGSEGLTSAEDGAAYDQRRTDGTSAHYYHDQDSTVQCVLTADQAHTARGQGNRRGIHHELCGKANQGVAGWADVASWGTLAQAARQCARDAKKWDIPVKRLTPTQVAAGAKGFCGHDDISKAFRESTHTDPGPTFPWTAFLDMVRDELEGIMPITPADVKAIAAAVQNVEVGRSGQTLGQMIQVNTTALQALLVLAKMEAAEIPPSVQQVVDGIEAAFGTGSPEETAAALKAVLGDKAEQVGRLLAGQA